MIQTNQFIIAIIINDWRWEEEKTILFSIQIPILSRTLDDPLSERYCIFGNIATLRIPEFTIFDRTKSIIR